MAGNRVVPGAKRAVLLHEVAPELVVLLGLPGVLALPDRWNLEKSSIIAKASRELADKIGFTLTQAQLRRALTVVGAALGAGFNGYLGHSTSRAAYHLYRERMLGLGTR